jgi:hypothetical protein
VIRECYTPRTNPDWYYIVRQKGDIISKVLEYFPENVAFRRDTLGPTIASSNVLLQRLTLVQLAQWSDEFRWNLHENDKFYVDSVCKALMQPMPDNNKRKIWKMKIPLKTNFFAWYLCRRVILTKDNLVKHNWHGSTKCVLCHHDNIVKH